MMDSSDQNDRQDGKSRTRSPRHGSNAVRDVLTTVAKLNNIGRSTAAILRASTVGGSNDSDPSAAKTADCPASPRPAHTSTFQGPGEDDTRVEASSQTIPLSPPGPLPVTQGAHVQDSQYPPPGLVFGNRGPPPGFSAANQQQIDNFGPLGFRGLPPPPGFGPSFGNRLYSPVFRPPMMFEKCFSLAATRVYDNRLFCDRCGGGSDLGWFYRCCHDADARIFESIKDGNKECFDEIGEVFTRDLKYPDRGAAARQDKLSPLKEMGPDQLKTYTSEQLGTILKQHENAVDTALKDRYGPFIPPAGDRPYLKDQAEECKITLCPRCGRGGMGEDLAWLSIDGVLKGDVPPTAAVGYGFRALGGRPVADARIVKNLGLRDPKTGRLPEKAPQDEHLAVKIPDIKVLSNEGEGVPLNETDEKSKPSEITQGRNILSMGDWKDSPESDRLDAASFMAEKGSEGNEDLFDLYANSEEGVALGKENSKNVKDDKSGAQ